jgi:hypothetical protein
VIAVGSIGRRVAAAGLLALAVGLAGGLLPAAAPGLPLPAFLDPAIARAADDLEITADTRYTVDPVERTVRVVVDLTAVNRKPNQGATRYFYDGLNLGVQPEARRFSATRDGSELRVRTTPREGYRLVTVLFGEKLYYGGTERLRLSFELPAGRPRSASDVRVGPAFATFTAWAFGDIGQVRIEIPSDFRVDTAGSELSPEKGTNGLQAWSAATSDPLSWYVLVNATNDAALTTDRLALEDGENVVIRAWPEDARWSQRVSVLLRDGLPQLAARIGLPWPVEGSLVVTEVHTPLLEGYAGFYDPETDRITISEDLDDLTIIHEASHAWFNGALFTERWITEGLADEYAALVLRADDRGDPGPGKVSRSDPAAFALNDWPPPAAIRDPEAGDRETYGYAASWALMRRIVARVGEPGMREVFAAAAAGTTAYPGEGDPELSRSPNGWRRFLDLAEQAADAANAPSSARSIADLLALWALDDADAALLPARAAALERYSALEQAGAGWAPPAAVRSALDEWDFGDAADVMDGAERVLASRDAIETLAAAEGLVPGPRLESDYEDSRSEAEINVVVVEAAESLETLQAIAAAGDAAEAPRDWLTSWGLDGTDPAAGVAAAGAAWEAGDLEAARTAAASVVATLAAAPDAGRSKAIAAALLVALAVLILLLIIVVLARRRRNRWVPVTVSAVPGLPESRRPYATLRPDGFPAEPPGGPAPGDEGADGT